MAAHRSQREQNTRPPDFAAAKERAAAACRNILSACHTDGQGLASKETVRAALAGFADHGLLDLAFLDPAATAVPVLDLRRAAAIIEALAAHSGALASVYMVNAIVAGACIAVAGTPEQKAYLLPRLRRGELSLALALTEPEAGSDAASLTTTALPDGVGSFRLTGEKIFATGAATADYILVVARVGGMAGKRAFSIFLVPAGAPGVTVEPLAMLAGDLHASCRVRLADVPIGPEAVLGGATRLGTAWDTLRLTGLYERIVVAALSLGLASAIVDRSVTFARRRHQFGQPIAAFQVIQHALVEMKTTETAMRLFVENALAALEGGDDATQAVCMAKYVCAEQLQRVTAKGMRVMGGRAYFAFEDMARFYREAPFSMYAGGTVEIQKMLVARTMGLG